MSTPTEEASHSGREPQAARAQTARARLLDIRHDRARAKDAVGEAVTRAVKPASDELLVVEKHEKYIPIIWGHLQAAATGAVDLAVDLIRDATLHKSAPPGVRDDRYLQLACCLDSLTIAHRGAESLARHIHDDAPAQAPALWFDIPLSETMMELKSQAPLSDDAHEMAAVLAFALKRGQNEDDKGCEDKDNKGKGPQRDESGDTAEERHVQAKVPGTCYRQQERAQRVLWSLPRIRDVYEDDENDA